LTAAFAEMSPAPPSGVTQFLGFLFTGGYCQFHLRAQDGCLSWFSSPSLGAVDGFSGPMEGRRSTTRHCLEPNPGSSSCGGHLLESFLRMTPTSCSLFPESVAPLRSELFFVGHLTSSSVSECPRSLKCITSSFRGLRSA